MPEWRGWAAKRTLVPLRGRKNFKRLDECSVVLRLVHARETGHIRISSAENGPINSWRTFLLNHADGIASIDLFVVPTISFRLLYGLLVLRHDRRRIL